MAYNSTMEALGLLMDTLPKPSLLDNMFDSCSRRLLSQVNGIEEMEGSCSLALSALPTTITSRCSLLTVLLLNMLCMLFGTTESCYCPYC